jgi:hypothetical protein
VVVIDVATITIEDGKVILHYGDGNKLIKEFKNRNDAKHWHDKYQREHMKDYLRDNGIKGLPVNISNKKLKNKFYYAKQKH